MKAAIVVLADTDTHEALRRLVNTLEAVKEFKDNGEDVQLIFDGAGTRWVVELAHPEHKAHDLCAAVRDKVSGVCEYCAAAFGVTEQVKAGGVPLVAEFEGHPSLRTPLHRGYQVITF